MVSSRLCSHSACSLSAFVIVLQCATERSRAERLRNECDVKHREKVKENRKSKRKATNSATSSGASVAAEEKKSAATEEKMTNDSNVRQVSRATDGAAHHGEV